MRTSKKRRKIKQAKSDILVIGAGMSGMTTARQLQENDHSKNMDNQAPQFQLKDINENQVSLASLKGKWVILVFYRGSWCPMCNMQIATLAKDYPKFQKLNAEIIAISTDTPKGAQKTKEKSQAPFPILIDTDNQIIHLYKVDTKKRELKDMPALVLRKKVGTYAMPAVFIIDAEGIIRYSYIGKSLTDRPSNEDLLHKLQELQQ